MTTTRAAVAALAETSTATTTAGAAVGLAVATVASRYAGPAPPGAAGRRHRFVAVVAAATAVAIVDGGTRDRILHAEAAIAGGRIRAGLANGSRTAAAAAPTGGGTDAPLIAAEAVPSRAGSVIVEPSPPLEAPLPLV